MCSSSPEQSDRVAALLSRVRAGEREAGEELARVLEPWLHRLASRMLRDQRPDHTLQPTALVHEAWMRFAAGAPPQGRAHFLRLAAATMRSVLVDHARRRLAGKRGGGARRLGLEELAERGELDQGPALLELHDELEQLQAVDPRAAEVAQMRVFGGMERLEIAEALGVSPRSVDRAWSVARERLGQRFEA